MSDHRLQSGLLGPSGASHTADETKGLRRRLEKVQALLAAVCRIEVCRWCGDTFTHPPAFANHTKDCRALEVSWVWWGKRQENTDDQWMIALALAFPRSALGEMCEHRLASNGHLCGGPACSERWPSQVAFRLLIRWLMISMLNLCWLSYERLVHDMINDDTIPIPITLIGFELCLPDSVVVFCVQWQDLV